jgi:hypothetical protein
MPEGALNPPRPLDIYFNDHLAGATGACELARNAAETFRGTPHAGFLSDLVAQIEQDRATLEQMMEQLGAARNPIKQAGAWIMEKFSRFKLGGAGGADPELAALLAFETLALGVQGKACLWTALKEVVGDYPELGSFDLDGLLARAESQLAGIERERLTAARQALAATAGISR